MYYNNIQLKMFHSLEYLCNFELILHLKYAKYTYRLSVFKLNEGRANNLIHRLGTCRHLLLPLRTLNNYPLLLT